MSAPFVVGVAGGTASGKTTLAEGLAERWGATLVAFDRYYNHGTPNTNFDHPDALDIARLLVDLDHLRAGDHADLPRYDFATHRRQAAVDRVSATPMIVVEGILLLVDPAVRARLDLAVFVHAAPDVRLIRRVRRDVSTRGRTVESVFEQYLRTVRPMHDRYVEPSRGHAHLLADGEAVLAEEIARVAVQIEQRRPAPR